MARKLFASIAGSTLLAINDDIVVNKTNESVQFLLQTMASPVILLISCPYQHSPVSPVEITEYMSHNGYTITNFASTHLTSLSTESLLVDCPSMRVSAEGHFSHQQNYTEQPFAVDAFMFPQSQGYAILEKQWMKWEMIMMMMMVNNNDDDGQ